MSREEAMKVTQDAMTATSFIPEQVLASLGLSIIHTQKKKFLSPRRGAFYLVLTRPVLEVAFNEDAPTRWVVQDAVLAFHAKGSLIDSSVLAGELTGHRDFAVAEILGMEDHPGCAELVARIRRDHTMKLKAKLSELMLYGIKDRITRLGSLADDLNTDQIASMIGTSRNSVSKALKELGMSRSKGNRCEH